ncbi:esterase-like activity of phytase family protein [Novosphingobium sp. Chol11]|uniref:esterase-like activity of phytase family protein n=1 Tax=Novosphingobium sp. Chol11 TaxID=1385763 RepID=UPI0025EB3A1A|nr:esterase-like activity of phytase family protein [Novosphingobium sp. Chol11]
MRILPLAVLILALIPAVFLHAPPPPQSEQQIVRRVDLMPSLAASGRAAGDSGELGAFELAGAWKLTSPHRKFGNFSALVHDRAGMLIALGDRGGIMRFSPPDRPGRWFARIGLLVAGDPRKRSLAYDAEAAVADPASGRLLVGYEDRPALFDYPADGAIPRRISVPVLREWPGNQGPEAMTTLADGRTIILGEVYSRWFDRRIHPGLIFPGKPRDQENPARFEIAMPAGFRPTELAQMPDGRVLVLGRSLLAHGFSSTISVFDPGELRAGKMLMPRLIAKIARHGLRENFEGMTSVRDADGSIAVWLISDSNKMVLAQRTLLLKLRLKPGS